MIVDGWISIGALLAQLVFQTLERLQHLHRIGRDERGLLGQVALQEFPRLSTRAEDLLRLGVDSVLKLEREHPGHSSPSGLVVSPRVYTRTTGRPAPSARNPSRAQLARRVRSRSRTARSAFDSIV